MENRKDLGFTSAKPIGYLEARRWYCQISMPITSDVYCLIILFLTYYDPELPP